MPFADETPDDNELWQPLHHDHNIEYPPGPSSTIRVFNENSRLCTWRFYTPISCFMYPWFSSIYLLSLTAIIVGGIISRLYPVRPSGESRRLIVADIESQLNQWFVNLPDDLRYDTANRGHVPPPNILMLNMRYWGALLLLNRAL